MKFRSVAILQSLCTEGVFFLVDARTNCFGQKFHDLSGDSPSSVAMITSAEIRECGYRNLVNALRIVRSFYATYDRNYSSLVVRGGGWPCDDNPRILLPVDGHRMNGNVYGEATIGAEFLLDVDMIQRVEIVHGTASSLYGSNALSAVIHVVTRQGREVNGMELSAEAASFHNCKGNLRDGLLISWPSSETSPIASGGRSVA